MSLAWDWQYCLNLCIFQIAKFIGGESSPLILEQDPSGGFITSLEVDRIEADSGDTYGCQPNPGVAAEVKVHVIKEGNIKRLGSQYRFRTYKLFQELCSLCKIQAVKSCQFKICMCLC